MKRLSLTDLERDLELGDGFFVPFFQAFTHEKRKQELARLKELGKKKFKELARKYHPDRPGGDDAKMKRIANAYALFKDLQAIEPGPPPRVDNLTRSWRIVINQDGSFSQAEEMPNSTTSSSGFEFFWR